MKIFHGSQFVIENPTFGGGRAGNDFGRGFYCTESEELAKEWGVGPMTDGFANAYELDTDNLNILRLNSPDFTVLNWMAILVSHRQFRVKAPIAAAAVRYLKSRFAIGVDSYDIVTGYRADDSYFDFAEAFLNNTITIEQLSRALRLGKLGEQIVVKSREAFSRLRFLGAAPADHTVYYPRRDSRNRTAEAGFLAIQEKGDFRGLYMNVILSERIGNDDARIPRNAPA